MVENEERTLKEWLRIIIPRVLAAALWGLIMGGWLLILLNILPVMDGGLLQRFLVEQTGFSYILVIFIGFEVAIQLLKGTVIQYALSVARTMISMLILISVTNGGIMTLAVPQSPEAPFAEVSISFTIDFRTVLSILLTFSILSVIKNILQAINFLSEKAEEPIIPPELP